MSKAFGWNVETVEEHVVNLIQSGEIQGRIDSQNKVSSMFFSKSFCTNLSLSLRFCMQRKRTIEAI